MDFNQQTFGSLLFFLENEYLKKEIRNIENMNKRLIHIKSGINFNNMCLKEGLQSKCTHTHIYIYIFEIIKQWCTTLFSKPTFSHHKIYKQCNYILFSIKVYLLFSVKGKSLRHIYSRLHFL